MANEVRNDISVFCSPRNLQGVKGAAKVLLNNLRKSGGEGEAVVRVLWDQKALVPEDYDRRTKLWDTSCDGFVFLSAWQPCNEGQD